MNFPICEMFCSIQGEGKRVGIPSIFIRVSGCNLRCVFAGGSKCDTPYSSFKPDKSLFETIDEAVKSFETLSNNNPKVRDVVITGGEPLMYKDGLQEFLTKIFKLKSDWMITIETNGTYPPLNPTNRDFKVDLYSVSPKLSTSVDTDCKVLSFDEVKKHNDLRLNYKSLFQIAMYSKDYQFKFVYSNAGCETEILNIYKEMSKFVEPGDDCETEIWMRRHPMKNTQLMPEGITNEQLDKNRKDIVNVCIRNGWRFTDREHIVIWGDKRGV